MAGRRGQERTGAALREGLTDAPVLRLVAIAGHVTRNRWRLVTDEQHGLTPAGSNVLLMLAWGLDRGGGLSAPRGETTHAELASRLWIRPATLTGIIDTLVKAGLVERRRDTDDRRVVRIALTDDGQARARQIGVQIRESFPPTAIERDPAKQAVIREFLLQLIETYGEDVDDDWTQPPRRRGRGD